MQSFREFFQKKTPKSGMDIPLYFRHATIACESLLAICMGLSLFLFFSNTYHWEWVPTWLLALVLASIAATGHVPLRLSLGVYAAITFIFSAWYVHTFGWGCGGQHYMIPLMILMFFNVYDPPWLKILGLVATIACRMALYGYSMRHAPLYALDDGACMLFQTLNSVTYFLMMACECILFSSNIQETERKLRLDNQELHKEAGTDPLTQLPNRRSMLDRIDLFRKTYPDETFSVAIADIDFFKKVNDTYGHNCVDYTLKRLADVFRDACGDKISVCRWGGEEFCFFLPFMNVDDAGATLMHICNDVRRMELDFEAFHFKITITIGVEENDFSSSLETILDKADQKLYMGKSAGRDRVVM